MLRALLSPLIRARCVVCDLQPASGTAPICKACESDFFPQHQARCERCAGAVAAGAASRTVCGRCLADTPHFDATTALADYVSPVDGMVLALKFAARLDLADLFGRMLAQRIDPAPAVAHDILVVPVPLSFERAQQRGFNQSNQIARAIAAAGGGRLSTDRLLRVRHAPPQQSLSLKQRRGNVRGAFAVKADVAGKSVLVVDDVMTSGSTLDEVARVLKQAGASRVHNVVVARTP